MLNESELKEIKERVELCIKNLNAISPIEFEFLNRESKNLIYGIEADLRKLKIDLTKTAINLDKI